MEDFIILVNEEWLAFAVENNAGNLTHEAVVGRPLWDFIAGRETRHIYKLLLDKVKSALIRVTIPFRCDSPGKKRFMTMDISPARGKSVDFHCELLKEEDREPVRLLAPEAERSKEFLRICSWCRRAATGPEEWLEAEDAIKALDLFGAGKMPQITHTICPDCHKIFLQKWKTQI